MPNYEPTSKQQLDEIFKYKNQGLNVGRQIDPALEIIKLSQQFEDTPPIGLDESTTDYALRIQNRTLTHIRKVRKMKSKKLKVQIQDDFKPEDIYFKLRKNKWYIRRGDSDLEMNGQKLVGIEDDISINFYLGTPKLSSDVFAKTPSPEMTMTKFKTKEKGKSAGFIKLGSNPFTINDRNVLAFKKYEDLYTCCSVLPTVTV